MELSDLFSRRSGILVAISGGADSVALLHKLVAAGYGCVAAHCNFHLRGQESDSDMEFVSHLCEKLGVPLRIAHFDTKSVAAQRGISIEMAARDLRYAWFHELLDAEGLECVAVAHHADDAAETFMLNLTRGTGLRGLTGMKARQGRVVRPLLGMSRADIELYCKAHGLSFVTDSSNASDDFSRNRIRHHVIPELKAINPSLLATMADNVRHLSGVYAIFRRLVDDFVAKSVTEAQGRVLVSMQALLSLPDAEPYLFEILSPYGFAPRCVADIARCVAARKSGRLFVSRSHRAVVDREALIVMPLQDVPAASQSITIEALPATLSEPLKLEAEVFDVEPSFQLSRSPMLMHLDADKVALPITLRHWQRGDVFRPLGMKGMKKLSDFFVDAKLSLPDKEEAWVVESAGQIVAILGMRPDDRFKVTAASKRVLQLSFSK